MQSNKINVDTKSVYIYFLINKWRNFCR